jgi:mRNA-degrading endonuclease RelE of RelBE toxin-antitoxin system
MHIRWSDAGVASVRRFMRDDQDGLREVSLAILALADDPYPAGAFHRGSYHRLRAGRYRVLYSIAGDAITIERVDRLPS